METTQKTRTVLLTAREREALAAFASEVGCCRVAVLAPVFEGEDARRIETLRVVNKAGRVYKPTPTSKTYYHPRDGLFYFIKSTISFHRNKRSSRGYSGELEQVEMTNTCPPMSQSDGQPIW